MARNTAAQARSEIVMIAARLFAERSYEATSVQDIANELGGSKATVLYHFRSKAMILRELMTPAAEALRSMLDEVDTLPAEARRRAAAVGLVDTVIRFRNALASYPAAIRRIVEISELESLNFAGLGERLRVVLTGGREDALDQIAMISMVNGVLAAAQTLPDHDPAELQQALEVIALRTLGLTDR